MGELAGKDPTTISYWLKRHGLRATNADRFAPKLIPIAEQELAELVEEGASLNELAHVFQRSISSIRYWLAKYGLKTAGTGRRRSQLEAARKAGLTRTESTCSRHGHTEFVLEARGYWRCAKCRSKNVSDWRRRTKRRLIETAGGACVLCGYDKCPAALQFHHLKPAEKSFAISHAGETRALAALKAEAAKCVLLCANCHAEVEGGYTVLRN